MRGRAARHRQVFIYNESGPPRKCVVVGPLARALEARRLKTKKEANRAKRGASEKSFRACGDLCRAKLGPDRTWRAGDSGSRDQRCACRVWGSIGSSCWRPTCTFVFAGGREKRKKHAQNRSDGSLMTAQVAMLRSGDLRLPGVYPPFASQPNSGALPAF